MNSFLTEVPPSAALAQHELKVLKYLDVLEQCIEADAMAGKLSDMRNLLFWFGFDVMGEFVFNKSFDMLENQQWHYIIIRLQSALSLLGPFSPAPWLIQLGFKLGPRFSALKDWDDMVAWCEGQMRQRVEDGKSKELLTDLTHYLMEMQDGEAATSGDAWRWMKGDSLLAIVAGR